MSGNAFQLLHVTANAVLGSGEHHIIS